MGTADITRLPAAAQLALVLAPFLSFLSLGLWIGMRLLHRRPFSTLVRTEARFCWKSFFISAGLWLALAAAGDLIYARLQPAAYHFAYDAGAFWPYVLVAVLLLPVQVLAEETYFRGYLTQAFGLAGGIHGGLACCGRPFWAAAWR